MMHPPQPRCEQSLQAHAEAYQSSMYGFFKRSRLQNLLGQSGGSLVIVLLTWQIANQSALLAYLLIHQILVLLSAYSFYSESTNKSLGKNGLPKYVETIGIVTKSFCGSIFWFDLHAARDFTFVISILLVLCASVVGVTVTLGPLKRLARQTLVCLLLPGAFACFYVGHSFIAVAILFFLLVVACRGMADMHRSYAELISLRVSSLEIANTLKNNNQRLKDANDELEQEVIRRELMEKERAQLQEELVAASREAGKAEIATGVLHNVGNVMNSVNVGAGIMYNEFRDSFQKQLKSAIGILDANVDDLAGFFKDDPRAGYFLPFLKELNEKSDQIHEEMHALRENVDHVIAVVAAQQSFATTVGVMATVKPREVMDSAIHICHELLLNQGIEISKDYDQSHSDMSVDKQKLIQILVNLLKNSANAIADNATEIPCISVRVKIEQENVSFSVTDNGIGINKEDLDRIFQHGFSTRKDRGGHGFGLHHSINAIKEMGGDLSASSDGPGLGATFVVRLPIRSESSDNSVVYSDLSSIESGTTSAHH